MEIAIIVIFIIGYIFITAEHLFCFNKTATAILTGVLCWVTYILFGEKEKVLIELSHHIGEISEIILFILAVMTIVELIDLHNGFDVITKRIKAKKESSLLWIISITAFFLSTFLDNLTTAIVMIILLKKIVKDKEKRLLFTGMVVISANAGGACSPIGDVTTTMLWINGNITTANVIGKLAIPSILCVVVPLIILSFKLKGNIEYTFKEDMGKKVEKFDRRIVFIFGILSLISIPIFKTFTHLPPYMGALSSLSILWMLTGFIHKEKEEEVKTELSVTKALSGTDMPSVLFFMGILLSVSALESIGVLHKLGIFLENTVKNYNIIAILIGIVSSVIDNVPLVAASIGMYPLSVFPTDSDFWELLTYCAGTGGSILIIGSAAGVAAMGLEKINFGWYLKNISLYAIIGYFSGIAFYFIQAKIF